MLKTFTKLSSLNSKSKTLLRKYFLMAKRAFILKLRLPKRQQTWDVGNLGIVTYKFVIGSTNVN